MGISKRCSTKGGKHRTKYWWQRGIVEKSTRKSPYWWAQNKNSHPKGQLSKLIAKVLFFVRGDMFVITVRSSFPMTRTIVGGVWI